MFLLFLFYDGVLLTGIHISTIYVDCNGLPEVGFCCCYGYVCR
jgi:hypothetical protein